jgi:hypothetical protein
MHLSDLFNIEPFFEYVFGYEFDFVRVVLHCSTKISDCPQSDNLVQNINRQIYLSTLADRTKQFVEFTWFLKGRMGRCRINASKFGGYFSKYVGERFTVMKSE